MRGTIIAVALVTVLSSSVLAQVDDHYWELGVGCYYAGARGVTDLDVARYDWLYLCFGNISATPRPSPDQPSSRSTPISRSSSVSGRLWAWVTVPKTATRPLSCTTSTSPA